MFNAERYAVESWHSYFRSNSSVVVVVVLAVVVVVVVVQLSVDIRCKLISLASS